MSRILRLGLFIVGTLAILFAGVFLIGSKQLKFRHTYRLMAMFPNVGGLQEGADVRVGGIHEGTVRRIDLPTKRDGQVVVAMDLEPRTRAVVNKASMAFVKSEGLLGDKYVEVSFGKPDAEPVKDGDTIQSKPPIDISDLIQKTDRILSSTDDAMQHVQATSNNLQELTTRINEGKGSVGALINDRTLYQQASAGVTAFQEDMEALKHNFLVRGFFRNRGYEDATEIKKHAISKLPPTPPVGDFVLDATKMFAKEDSAKLRNQKVMEPAGHFLESHPFGLAVVAASTGEKGDTEKSRTLSEARAAVVREYLAQHFRVDDTRIKTLAVGKTGEPGDKPKIEIVAYAVAR